MSVQEEEESTTDEVSSEASETDAAAEILVQKAKRPRLRRWLNEGVRRATVN